mmetsp:Transcript_35089/g.59569  ORF Transcript_35089/g.59569 Transcript_35089/m.59569 type:complete len:329 (+) Transcript_35089:112-1098(+)
MARAVDLILERPGMERMKSRSCLLTQGTIIPWTSPLQGTLAPMLEGYQVGLKTGDTESAGYNLVVRARHLFYVGRPLDSLEHELQAQCDLLVLLNLSPAKYAILPYLLVVKILRGVDISDEKDFESLEEYALEMKMDNLRARVIAAQLELLVVLSDWNTAKKQLGTEDLRQFLTGLFVGARFTLLEALILLKQAQGEPKYLKKRKWKKRALKPIRILRGWAKKGNVNIMHYVHLVEAELAFLDGKCEEAEESYKSAISVASRNGFLQDKALSHELASRYFSVVKGDDYWKEYHLDSAIKSYIDWGATVKAEQLKSMRQKWESRRLTKY